MFVRQNNFGGPVLVNPQIVQVVGFEPDWIFPEIWLRQDAFDLKQMREKKK